ncbi:hypothetical protein LEP1GSC062_2871 [Leptospira alexanderi serovar Manhao 3 str. L 60]|uniref:Uncharacterized protein n=1 Tax=Leptospira alexanderi serovar Manhao 3 str. L 60 TaxID=1049759 RepID=V6IE72_9LEPT|nr:hypothetical protein LEP1GSC062_2871 [Leptospira alexanderi serovar Manhao 3 str. L 60]
MVEFWRIESVASIFDKDNVSKGTEMTRSFFRKTNPILRRN